MPYFPDAATVPCGLSSGAAVFRNHLFSREGAMRIYYAARGLRGKPYHGNIINTGLFSFFQGKTSCTFPSEETLRAADAFPECERDLGEYTDYEYVCKEGTFYIPKSIGVGDEIDHYHVVLCGDEVELRHVRWDRPWYETVGRDTEITDPDIIAKMERTLVLFMKANTTRTPKPVPISHQSLLTFLTLLGTADAERLAEQIHAAATRPAEFHAIHRDVLRNEFGFMEEPYTGWHVVLLRLALRERQRLDWVDWKEAPEEVFASLCSLLPPGADEHLPPCDNEDAYPEEVLHTCNPVLHELYGLTILLWDTGGDEYVFMVVPRDRVPEMFAAASDLGITLQQVDDVFEQA